MGEVRRIPAVDVEHVRVARMSSSRLRCPCLDVISMHLLHHRSDYSRLASRAFSPRGVSYGERRERPDGCK
jgi:hypothetical protein